MSNGLSEEEREQIRRFLREKRRDLSRPSSIGKGTPAEKLNRARFGRKVTQKLRRATLGVKRSLSKELRLLNYTASPILDSLLPERRARWLHPLKRRNNSEIISIGGFSLLEDPNRTLDTLHTLAVAEAEAIDVVINFEDEHCLDMGPFLVLGEIWPRLSPLLRGGRMAPPVQRVLEAVGLRRMMGIQLGSAHEGTAGVWAFPVKQRKALERDPSGRRLLVPQRSQIVADKFCNAIDRWLGVSTSRIDAGNQTRRRLTLKDEGRAWITSMILELLDNA